MTNEQHPNPWSRDGWRAPDTWQPPAHPNAPAQPGPQSHPAQDQRTPYPQPTPQPESHVSASYGPPSPFGTPTPTTSAPRSRSRVAGLLAVAVLAAGVGGGAGFAASQWSGGVADSAASASASASTEATETQIVQADPNNPNWTEVAESAVQAVVAIQVQGQDGSAGQGSGVVIDADGHIVTNNHVVSGSGSNAQIVVLLDDTSYAAEVVGTDPSTDLAVIKLVDPPSKLTVMSIADESELQVGDPVMAIGNPLGLADTVTTGIVSALNRPVTTRAVSNTTIAQGRDDLVVTAAIQTNAAINPGNSGGALVNGEGQLVGVTSSIASLASSSSSQAGNIGLGFAIGAGQVQYVTEQLIEKGVAEHPQIGISASDVSGTGPLGAVVAEVVAGSPAEEGGLRAGDLITEVDGAPVSSTESLVALVRNGQVGREMTLSVVRDDEEIEVTVTPVAAAR
ncbi:S1C family serine protease [Tessaracoccus lapidicaptus]|uniref:S1C family serine protease n=1 Tax=Tessaracoccus lapidicaptus TaxID=1427523 RepID=UPI0033414C61